MTAKQELKKKTKLQEKVNETQGYCEWVYNTFNWNYRRRVESQKEQHLKQVWLKTSKLKKKDIKQIAFK